MLFIPGHDYFELLYIFRIYFLLFVNFIIIIILAYYIIFGNT